jgi:hypothetical protein
MVLSALAVAGGPVSEGLLEAVSGLGAVAVRRGLRELTSRRLLADGATVAQFSRGMPCWLRRWQ